MFLVGLAASRTRPWRRFRGGVISNGAKSRTHHESERLSSHGSPHPNSEICAEIWGSFLQILFKYELPSCHLRPYNIIKHINNTLSNMNESTPNNINQHKPTNPQVKVTTPSGLATTADHLNHPHDCSPECTNCVAAEKEGWCPHRDYTSHCMAQLKREWYGDLLGTNNAKARKDKWGFSSTTPSQNASPRSQSPMRNPQGTTLKPPVAVKSQYVVGM